MSNKEKVRNRVVLFDYLSHTISFVNLEFKDTVPTLIPLDIQVHMVLIILKHRDDLRAADRKNESLFNILLLIIIYKVMMEASIAREIYD